MCGRMRGLFKKLSFITITIIIASLLFTQPTQIPIFAMMLLLTAEN
jgi:hypothetical protein